MLQLLNEYGNMERAEGESEVLVAGDPVRRYIMK
jgi:hypothetical protein